MRTQINIFYGAPFGRALETGRFKYTPATQKSTGGKINTFLIEKVKMFVPLTPQKVEFVSFYKRYIISKFEVTSYYIIESLFCRFKTTLLQLIIQCSCFCLKTLHAEKQTKLLKAFLFYFLFYYLLMGLMNIK